MEVHIYWYILISLPRLDLVYYIAEGRLWGNVPEPYYKVASRKVVAILYISSGDTYIQLVFEEIYDLVCGSPALGKQLFLRWNHIRGICGGDD